MALLTPSDIGGRTQENRFARVPLALLAVVLAAALSPGIARAQATADEYQVKAAYVLNFARFVEWPAAVLPPSAPLRIAIVGQDPFGGALEAVLRGKSANGHPIELRHERWDDVLTAYQIVFISVSEESHLSQIIRDLGRNSALTVSDIDRFSLRGGVIEFCTVGNRLRFDINRTPAIAARLTISSKLLSVARAVHERSVPQ
jgi:hypothetical protein